MTVAVASAVVLGWEAHPAEDSHESSVIRNPWTDGKGRAHKQGRRREVQQDIISGRILWKGSVSWALEEL